MTRAFLFGSFTDEQVNRKISKAREPHPELTQKDVSAGILISVSDDEDTDGDWCLSRFYAWVFIYQGDGVHAGPFPLDWIECEEANAALRDELREAGTSIVNILDMWHSDVEWKRAIVAAWLKWKGI